MNSDPQEPNEERPLGRSGIIAISVAVEGGMLALAWVLGLLFGVPWWQTIDITGAALGLAVLLMLPMMILAFGIVELPWMPGRQIREDFSKIITLFEGCTIADLLCISLLAGFGEEALFRGLMQSYFAEIAGPVGAVLVVSLIFALFHAISYSYVVFAFIIGAYLGTIYVWTTNLMIPITIHALYDFLALVYALRIRPIPKSGDV